MKTALMTLALLCTAAPLVAQQADAPIFDAQGVPTKEFVSSFMGYWSNPKNSREIMRFNVSIQIPQLAENDRRRYNKAEKSPYEINIHFFTETENDSRITQARRGQVTSTANSRRATTTITPAKGTIYFLLVDENNTIVKKMSGDSSRFRPLRDEAKFGTYKVYAWSKHFNGMFGATTNMTLYIPPVEPTMPTKK